MNYPKKSLKYLIVIGFIPLSVVSFLVYKNLSPHRLIKDRGDFLKDSKFISQLYPAGTTSKISIDGKDYTALEKSSSYFYLKIPKDYTRALIKIRFKNESEEFLFRVKGSGLGYHYTRVWDNKNFNNLDWHHISEKDTILFERNKHYSSLEEFYNNPPEDSIIGTCYFENYSRIQSKFLLKKDYKKSEQGLNINHCLRGSHRIYTYIKDEPLDFYFYKQNLNWHNGSDILVIDVLKDNQSIFTKIIPDDGIEDDSKRVTQAQEVHIKIPDLDEGVYEIKLDIPGGDALIRNIKSAQHLLVFTDKIFLADNNIYQNCPTEKTTIYTDATRIKAKTLHPEGFQKIIINEDRSININQIDQIEEIRLPFQTSELNKINVEKNDIEIQSEYFSFSEESFFRPQFPTLVSFEEVNLNDLDYIITNYNIPTEESDWLVNQYILNLTKFGMWGDLLRIGFFVPRFNPNSKVLIDYIEVAFSKT